MDKKSEGVQLPADLTSLSDEELAQLEQDATAEFDSQLDSDEGDPNTRLARATELADIIDTVRAEQGVRQQVAQEREAQALELRNRVHPEDPDEGEAGEQSEGEEPPAVQPTEPVPAGVTAGATVTRDRTSATDSLVSGRPVPQAPRRLNPTLSEIQAKSKQTVPRRRDPSVLVASSDIPNVQQGSRLADMEALVAAMHLRARALPDARKGVMETPWYPVASLQLEPRYTLDMQATAEEVNEVLLAATDTDALVAAGGWCAPSEISYDFYNIVCEDGMIDLPTVGINRGGMRWPTSASYGDIVNNFWTWTETQDVAALTGTAQSGTKVCYRVPCPTFSEERLRCDGFCLTVGNLMSDAFPELIANHTRLLFAGHAHRMNTLRINALLGSTCMRAVTGQGTAGAGVVAPVLSTLELQSIDIREKYKMCEDAVLEVVLPRWLRGAMRADLRRRTGVDLLEVNDARLMNMFDLLNIRVQWVTDWQVGGVGQPGGTIPPLVWPTSVQFMMWPAGTYVLGRGLQLNLGVIRDSVLNATNDYTAEWMEECWLLACVGHEARLGTIAICADGTTGAADLTNCQ